MHTFTVGFADPRFDESRWARQVAAHLGTRHTEQILSPADMIGILPRWAELFDEPFGDSSGVPTFLVSSMARENVKVALSADGGDELFSGYEHYGVVLDRERMLARVPRPARNAFSQALQLLPDALVARLLDRLPAPAPLRHAARRTVVDRLEKLRVMLPEADPATIYDLGMSSWTPAEDGAMLGGPVPPRPVLNGHPRSFADHMSCCDLRHYLPDDILTKVDRTTMAVGLEGREPLLDHRLVEFALRLPLGLRRGAARHQAPAAQGSLPLRARRNRGAPEAGLRASRCRAGCAASSRRCSTTIWRPSACATRASSIPRWSRARSATSGTAAPGTTASTCRRCGCCSRSRCGARSGHSGTTTGGLTAMRMLFVISDLDSRRRPEASGRAREAARPARPRRRDLHAERRRAARTRARRLGR